MSAPLEHAVLALLQVTECSPECCPLSQVGTGPQDPIIAQALPTALLRRSETIDPSAPLCPTKGKCLTRPRNRPPCNCPSVHFQQEKFNWPRLLGALTKSHPPQQLRRMDKSCSASYSVTPLLSPPQPSRPHIRWTLT